MLTVVCLFVVDGWVTLLHLICGKQFLLTFFIHTDFHGNCTYDTVLKYVYILALLMYNSVV